MSDSLHCRGWDSIERRRQHRLRALFDDAYAMLEPFLDPASGWTGHSRFHLAFRVVRTGFADLAHDEVHTLIAAIHRTYIERNPMSSDHLPRASELPNPAAYSA